MSIFDGFKGVYSADTLPNTPFNASNLGYIVNTAKFGEAGEHWVSFFFPKHGPCEYFDSYGFEPSLESFYDFIGNRVCIHNNITLQSLMSSTCGQYCVFILCARFYDYKFADIIKIFDHNNPKCNDIMVNQFVNSVFHTKHQVNDMSPLYRQISSMFLTNVI